MPEKTIDAADIISRFKIRGQFSHAEPIHVGHINDTILARTTGKESPDYVIQRINHKIFQNVDHLMENILRVTTHIKTKIKSTPESEEKTFVELVKCNNQKYYYRDETGDYWRCYVYCRNGSADFDGVTPLMAYEGGRALGRFQQFLSDLPGGPLHETIPGFHDLGKRLTAFKNALNKDHYNRATEVMNETDIFLARAEEMLHIHELGRRGEFPVRVTHNDTKFNNILFDENSNALCIIDLDTVMNGFVLYDFGDAIRTLTNTTEEDEPDTGKVQFDFELYEEFSKGYLMETRELLTKKEIRYLAMSARFMTYIVALRFLIDYLEGDVYYKTSYAKHNLDRTRNQLALLLKMEEKSVEMERVIQTVADHLNSSLLK